MISFDLLGLLNSYVWLSSDPRELDARFIDVMHINSSLEDVPTWSWPCPDFTAFHCNPAEDVFFGLVRLTPDDPNECVGMFFESEFV